MTDAPTPPRQRRPRQERGQRRIDEILDAAETLVSEVGTAASSIQEIARRAGASVGSIYHFFPTREAIFDALRVRFTEQARVGATEMLAQADAWARLELGVFVERLVSSLVDFIERRPAIFALALTETGQRVPRGAPVDEAIREALRATLARRYPRTSAAELSVRADVLNTIIDGVAFLMLRADEAGRRRLQVELQRALYGYLATCEAPPDLHDRP